MDSALVSSLISTTVMSSSTSLSTRFMCWSKALINDALSEHWSHSTALSLTKEARKRKKHKRQHTWSLPRSSRSPRIFTYIRSSKERRTRSKGCSTAESIRIDVSVMGGTEINNFQCESKKSGILEFKRRAWNLGCRRMDNDIFAVKLKKACKMLTMYCPSVSLQRGFHCTHWVDLVFPQLFTDAKGKSSRTRSSSLQLGAWNDEMPRHQWIRGLGDEEGKCYPYTRFPRGKRRKRAKE